MNWKFKNFIQHFLSKLPDGDVIYYFLQSHYGGFRHFDVKSKLFQGIRMLNGLNDINISIKDKTTLEIGTGWVPIIPMFFYILGQFSCYSFDIKHLIKPKLCLDAAQQLASLANYLQTTVPWAYDYHTPNRLRKLGENYQNVDELFKEIGLTYQAPIDDIRTINRENSIDLLFSNTTLEHIHPDEISILLRKSKAVLAENGVMVHLIDCSDHFNHGQRTLSKVNFLRYSEDSWKKYNSEFLYQNRLRASDYLKLFSEQGYKINYWKQKVDQELLLSIDSFPLDQKYRNYSKEDLCTTHVLVVASA